MSTYDVILNFGPESPAGEFFSAFANVIALKNGNKLFRLECSQLDETAHYLALVLSDQSKQPGFPLRIPHHMVLAIVDAAFPEKEFGFGSSGKTS
jgi:hypothetical protein